MRVMADYESSRNMQSVAWNALYYLGLELVSIRKLPGFIFALNWREKICCSLDSAFEGEELKLFQYFLQRLHLQSWILLLLRSSVSIFRQLKNSSNIDDICIYTTKSAADVFANMCFLMIERLPVKKGIILFFDRGHSRIWPWWGSAQPSSGCEPRSRRSPQSYLPIANLQPPRLLL